MLDIRFVRENPELVKENIRKKFQEGKLPLVDEAIALDAEKRAALAEAEALKAERNKLSKANGPLFGQLKKCADEAEKAEIQAKIDANNEAVKANSARLAQAEAKQAQAAASGKDTEKPAKKVIIDELVITNGKAAIRMPSLKLDFQADLPEIRLKDIGREKGQAGVTMAEASKRVLKAVSSQLGSASKQAVKNARLSLTIGKEGLGKAAEDLGNKVKSLFGK